MAAAGLATSVLSALARASLEGALLALAVGGLCRLRPALPAAARAGLWWLVSLRLLVGLLPLPAFALPLLPAAGRGEADVAPAPVAAAFGPGPAPSGPAPAADAPTGAYVSTYLAVRPGPPFGAGGKAGSGAGERGLAARVTWGRALVALWLGGLLGQVVALGRQVARWRGLVARAAPAPESLQALGAAVASRLGLARCPPVRLTAEARVPQVGGALRPVVLLPAGATVALSGEELAMVLGHELAHVRRRDLLLGWAPALAERAFFFHPAARLAAREYALAREAACDRLVVDALETAPREYGRLLVRLGVGASDARLVAAGASPSVRLLKRRLLMLEHARPPSRLLPPLVLALVTAAACAPVDVVRRPPRARPALAAPAPAPAAPPPPDAGGGVADEEASAPEAPGAPPADEAPRSARRGGKASAPSRTAWVFFDAKPGDDARAFAQGSSRDLEAARRARGSKPGPVLYVRRDDRAYVIVDPATLEAARTIMAPQRELGRQQGELGARQGELGARQGLLGARQGEMGARLGELAAKFAAAEGARVAEELRRARGRDEGEVEGERARRRRDDAADRERARRAQADYERTMRETEGRQRELAREQASLGERQAALGREQAKLGEKQREAAERAEREMRALLDRAVAAGIATPVR